MDKYKFNTVATRIKLAYTVINRPINKANKTLAVFNETNRILITLK